jgi:ActR/RegA family two-component response regulator
MNRFLLMDPDHPTMQTLGLACLERGVAAALADTLCEGVRVLLSHEVALIVVDITLLRLTPSEHAILFERVAPGVPVVVTVRPETSLETRVAYEVQGFRVMPRPVSVEDLVDKAAMALRG